MRVRIKILCKCAIRVRVSTGLRLIFYNPKSQIFLREIYNLYTSHPLLRNLLIERKNKIKRDTSPGMARSAMDFISRIMMETLRLLITAVVDIIALK